MAEYKKGNIYMSRLVLGGILILMVEPIEEKKRRGKIS